MIVIKHRRCRDVILLQVKARRLHGHDFSGAFLVQAELSGASCVGARFPGANLRGADLHDADLRDTILCGANLRGADLYGADLRGADLRGATLEETNLAGVIHDRRTRWPDGWEVAPSAPVRRLQQDRWLPGAWVAQGASSLREWGAPVAASLAAAAESRRGAVASRQRWIGQSGAPWISAIVLASGIVVAGAAILKQQSAARWPAVPSGPVVVIAPRPSRAVDAVPLRQGPRPTTPAPARQARISQPARIRPRRTLLARYVPHSSGRGFSQHAYRRVSVRVARKDVDTAPASSVRRRPITPEPLVAAQPGGASPRRVILAEYTPAEQNRSTEQPARCAKRERCKKPRREEIGPRVAEAWGNPGFHYGSGYDMYGMHLR